MRRCLGVVIVTLAFACRPDRPAAPAAPSATATSTAIAAVSSAPPTTVPNAPHKPTATPRTRTSGSARQHTIGADTARAAAKRVWQQLADGVASARLDPPAAEPTCGEDRCVWTLAITFPDEADRALLGTLEVDTHDGTIRYLPNDGHDVRWEIDAYLQHEKDAAAAAAAVRQFPEVDGFCKNLKRDHNLSCIVYVSEAGRGECARGADLDDGCWWHVYVGESHETHTARWATYLVERRAWRVGAVDAGCGLQRLPRPPGQAASDGCAHTR